MIALALAITLSGLSDQNGAAALDLPGLARLAVARSTGAQAARLRTEQEIAELSVRNASAFPELRADFRDWPFGSGPRHRASIELRLPVLAALSAAASGSLASCLERKGTRAASLALANLVRDVGSAYALAYSAQATVPAQAALVEARRRELEVLRLRVEERTARPSDLSKLEQDLADAEAGQAALTRIRSSALQRLAALTGRDLEHAQLAPIDLPPLASSPDEAARLAREQRAEARLLREEAACRREEAGLAWRQAAQIDVGVGYSAGSATGEPNGVLALAQVAAPIDTFWRTARLNRAELAGARALELDADTAAELAAAEARDGFDAHQRALGQEQVAQGRLRAALAEADELEQRRTLAVPSGEPATMPAVLAAASKARAAAVAVAESQAQITLTWLTLAAAIGTSPAVAADVPPAAPGAAPTRPPRDEAGQEARSGAREPTPAAAARSVHGMWVWRTQELLADPGAFGALAAHCARHALTELYLSVPRGVAEDPRLPPALVTLRAAGLRVEALMGEADWYRAPKRRVLLDRIQEIVRFGQAHPQSKFDGVHLDIEPYQLRENKGAENLRFLPELTETLRQARAATDQANLTLAADLPRRIVRASPAEGRALMAACPKLTLMLYALDRRRQGDLAGALAEHARRAMAWQTPGSAGQVVVGVRYQDHGPAVAGVARSVEELLAGAPGFAGWAVHDYAAWRGHASGKVE